MTDAPEQTTEPIRDERDILIEKLTARVDALEKANEQTIGELTKANNDLWAYLHPATGGAVIDSHPQQPSEPAEPYNIVDDVVSRLKAL